MAAISQSVQTLLGGVSQQPDPVKLPGQVRQADNVYLDPTFGCVKRPPTKFISHLENDIPRSAKWFSIFRDNNERYMACCYDDENATPNTRFRVFDADSGTERTVTYSTDAGDYLDLGDHNDLKFLTINDYTFIANPAVTVSMSSGGRVPEQVNEALVVVNQIGYNTTYAIDLLQEDEELQQVEVYRASELQISPSNWEQEDGDGGCLAAGTHEFTESNGLKYRVTVNCTPTQVITYEDANYYPTQVSMISSVEEFAYWAEIQIGPSQDVAANSYGYASIDMVMDSKNISVRVEARCVKVCDYTDADDNPASRKYWAFSSVDILSYESWDEDDDKPEWTTGIQSDHTATALSTFDAGFAGTGNIFGCNARAQEIRIGEEHTIYFELITVDKGSDIPVYSYKSVYSASVTLLNGGTNVREGDTFNPTFSDGSLYTITVTGESLSYGYESDATVSYTTPTDATQGTVDVAAITGSLITQINALTDWYAEGISNVIRIYKTDETTFNIAARGGSTEDAMYGIKETVNDISKLPTVGFEGVVLKVQNSVDTEADDYYVEFVTTGGIPGAGSWEETAKPGVETTLNASSMPHALVRESDGNFKIMNLSGLDDDDPISWGKREVGDEDTNPDPTFVGQKINNMVFHMNRLGFLSEDTVILSQPGDYFNFFISSAIAVSDADPIDMAATSTRPANLTAGISTAQGLLLFSTDAQFLMNTTDVAFGPSTAQINEVSNYAYRTNIDPMKVGSSIFFSTDSTNYSKVFEMSIKSVGSTPVVAEDTRTVPEYVPNHLTIAAASSNNNLALYGKGDKEVYCFKYWNQGEERVLAGWFRWKFAHQIRAIEFYDDVAYLIFYSEQTDRHCIGSMNLMDDPEIASIYADDRSFEPRLDLYQSSENVTTSVGTPINSAPTTRIELPAGTYAGQEEIYLQFNRSSGTYFVAFPVEFDTPLIFDNPHITVLDRIIDDSNGYNIGTAYNMSIELPGFYTKDQKAVDRVNIPMVETVNIELYVTGSYNVVLEKVGYEDRTLYFDAKSADVYIADSNPIVETSKKELHVFSRGDHASVTINSLDPLPAGITGYTWEGHYNNRGITRT